MAEPDPVDLDVAARIDELEARLRESEEMLGAIRRGEIDALVVGRPDEQRIYTLESADRPYRILIEQIQEGAVTLTEDGTVLYCNGRLARMLGVAQERLVGHGLQPFVAAQDAELFEKLLSTAKRSSTRTELTMCTADRTPIPVYLSLSLLQPEDGAVLLCGVLTDLTDQKLRLRELAMSNDRLAGAHARLLGEIAERERIEDALRQSQKMEAVGQLTGGLAHDFNNLLTGITGSLELLQTRIAQGRVQDVGRYIDAAQGAARRAAALTHRLLAFSRRQTLAPKATDINRLVAGMEELIDRTMGPEIRIAPAAEAGLWPTLVDPSQLENALLNLCINARDAMPGGGTLRIVTANLTFDRRAAKEHGVSPGDYVSLCVTDTGTGMPPEVVARAFDPFYTTKPIGQGTGLGLSMIYGFVRQSGGQVRIESRVGEGTTVCLYLPRHSGEAETDDRGAIARDAPRAGQGETVLVVDDEPTVRMLVTEVLEDLGYTAIEAADGQAGLEVLQSGIHIDLLVTDVGLPGGMNGRQLAEAARASRQALKILFITAYAESAVLSHGHLDAGMQVMAKPFALDALASRIKELTAR